MNIFFPIDDLFSPSFSRSSCPKLLPNFVVTLWPLPVPSGAPLLSSQRCMLSYSISGADANPLFARISLSVQQKTQGTHIKSTAT
jgi:hypothetical protein